MALEIIIQNEVEAAVLSWLNSNSYSAGVRDVRNVKLTLGCSLIQLVLLPSLTLFLKALKTRP